MKSKSRKSLPKIVHALRKELALCLFSKKPYHVWREDKKWKGHYWVSAKSVRHRGKVNCKECLKRLKKTK